MSTSSSTNSMNMTSPMSNMGMGGFPTMSPMGGMNPMMGQPNGMMGQAQFGGMANQQFAQQQQMGQMGGAPNFAQFQQQPNPNMNMNSNQMQNPMMGQMQNQFAGMGLQNQQQNQQPQKKTSLDNLGSLL